MAITKRPAGNYHAVFTVHIGAFGTAYEARQATQEVRESEELAAFKAWLREQYGGNWGGVR